jgi:hypothetical protein
MSVLRSVTSALAIRGYAKFSAIKEKSLSRRKVSGYVQHLACIDEVRVLNAIGSGNSLNRTAKALCNLTEGVTWLNQVGRISPWSARRGQVVRKCLSRGGVGVRWKHYRKVQRLGEVKVLQQIA